MVGKSRVGIGLKIVEVRLRTLAVLMRRLRLPVEKVEQLGFFLSQHLANHVALNMRDVAISEKLPVQRNIFLADKYLEGHQYAPRYKYGMSVL